MFSTDVPDTYGGTKAKESPVSNVYHAVLVCYRDYEPSRNSSTTTSLDSSVNSILQSAHNPDSMDGIVNVRVTNMNVADLLLHARKCVPPTREKIGRQPSTGEVEITDSPLASR